MTLPEVELVTSPEVELVTSPDVDEVEVTVPDEVVVVLVRPPVASHERPIRRPAPPDNTIAVSSNGPCAVTK